jgi:NTE family protein
MASKRVAIACQGGGTHAAFTWGVLTTILRTKKVWHASPEDGETFDIAAISSTSAGALCALATWYGLVPNTVDADCGSIDKAIERLDYLWTTFAATTPVEILHNQMVGTLLQSKAQGVPFPGSNPYDVSGNFGIGLSMMGARREYLEFPALLEALCPNFETVAWPQVAKAHLRILVGAIEVLSGNFEVFDSDKTLQDMGLLPIAKEHDQYSSTRWRMRRSISLEGVAASGTLPEILPAQAITGMVFPTCQPGTSVTRTGYYWDGLYSQNPPVRNLLDSQVKEQKPDEIWVIRINPQEFYPAWVSASLEEIRDRENELAGNLSLNQELDHILTINRWLEEHGNSHPPLINHKIVEVRTIKMTRETAWGLRHSSKFDRSSGHYARLRDEVE